MLEYLKVINLNFMRQIGVGGEGIEGRYNRELDPEEEDASVDVVASRLPELIPGLRITKKESKKTDDGKTPVHQKFNLLLTFEGRPTIIMAASSETREAARKPFKQALREKPFINTPYASHDLARALVYVDPGQIDAHYMNDPDNEQKLNEQMLESFRQSLMFSLSQTKLKSDRDPLEKLLTTAETAQKELKTKSQKVH